MPSFHSVPSNFLLFSLIGAEFIWSSSPSVVRTFASFPSSDFIRVPSSSRNSESVSTAAQITDELLVNPVFRLHLQHLRRRFRALNSLRGHRQPTAAHSSNRNCFFSPINCHLPPAIGGIRPSTISKGPTKIKNRLNPTGQ